MSKPIKPLGFFTILYDAVVGGGSEQDDRTHDNQRKAGKVNPFKPRHELAETSLQNNCELKTQQCLIAGNNHARLRQHLANLVVDRSMADSFFFFAFSHRISSCWLTLVRASQHNGSIPEQASQNRRRQTQTKTGSSSTDRVGWNVHVRTESQGKRKKRHFHHTRGETVEAERIFTALGDLVKGGRGKQ